MSIMQDISKEYGGEVAMSSPSNNSVDPSITYRPKEEYEPMPKGVRILSTAKEIYVNEIENGYLVTEDIRTKYEYVEKDGDTEERYHYSCRKYYAKNKPFEIQMQYPD